jgi:hypothetical protein
MTGEELQTLCEPLKPEEALNNLRDIYDYFANFPRNIEEEWLYALNAAIEVIKKVSGEE